jgi:hypothetical protein
VNAKDPIDRAELEKKISQGIKDFRERYDRWKADKAVHQVEDSASSPGLKE